MDPVTLLFGGVGGAYFLAEPGELVVEVAKRDRNTTSSSTRLTAILLGPDRRRLDEAVIPEDGQAQGSGLGPLQMATLTTTVEAKGVYVLNVTVTHDRYGEQVLWGLRSNCPSYLIETSRGHKDARHMEPIVLGPGAGSQDICFLPGEGPFEIEIADLDTDGPAPALYDGADALITSGGVTSGDGRFRHRVAGRGEGDGPWRLHLADGGPATVHIDGVTRWQRGERFDGLSLWSPRRDSFFPLHDLRWLLTPYRHAVPLAPGATAEVALRLHNNGAQADTVGLRAEGGELEVALSHDRVPLAAGDAATVTASLTAPPTAPPGAHPRIRIVATSTRHPAFATWSTLEARVDTTVSRRIEVPLIYRPYEHENERFAYTPDYPNDNQLYFAPDDRPFTLTGAGLQRLDADGWQVAPGNAGLRSLTSKVAFGGDGDLCLLSRTDAGVVYLRSTDGGDTFTAAAVPATSDSRQQFDIEQHAGHNHPAGPAPFVRATQTSGADPEHFWRRVNDLELFLPTELDGGVDLGDPVTVSQKAIGISSHSGIPSALASRGDRVHVIWGEATEPDADAPGVPAYVATYDRARGRWLGDPVCVGYGPPANDVHNTPSLVIDSEGYLHTLTGTHGSPFAYARSRAPDTAHEGFTEPVLVEEGLRSTYIGLVCGPDDTLHLVFRTWTEDGEYHPVSHYANLGYKRRQKGGDWEPMRRLAVAPFTEYSIWYHRLTVDRRGRLYVSFDYWSTFWFYRTDHVGARRKTIWSEDGGQTWQLLRTADLR
jgi:hypothetical protein